MNELGTSYIECLPDVEGGQVILLDRLSRTADRTRRVYGA